MFASLIRTRTFTSPGLDPGVFFGGVEEDAPVEPGQVGGGGGWRQKRESSFRRNDGCGGVTSRSFVLTLSPRPDLIRASFLVGRKKMPGRAGARWRGEAGGDQSWVPAFAGMTVSAVSTPPSDWARNR